MFSCKLEPSGFVNNISNCNPQIGIVGISVVNSNFVNGKDDSALGELTTTKFLCLHNKGHTLGQTQRPGMNLMSRGSFCC